MSSTDKTKKRKAPTTDDEASEDSSNLSSTSENYNCNGCPKSFKRINALCRHHKTHSKRKPYKCALCPLKIGTEYQLNRHIRKKHNKELKVNPDLKSYITIDVDVLAAEALELGVKDPAKFRLAEKDKVRCCVVGCNKIFFSVAHLRSHKQMHAQLQPYMCTYLSCIRAFSTIDELRQHSRVSHYLHDHEIENNFKVLHAEEEGDQPNATEKLCQEVHQMLNDVFPFSEAKNLFAKVVNYNPNSVEDKSSILYFFLHDDLCTMDLPDWETNLTSRLKLFKRFLLLVAYIGKGVEGRPEVHLIPRTHESDTSAAGQFFRDLLLKKKKAILLKSTPLISDASAARLESCVISSIKMGTNIVNKCQSLAKKTAALLSPEEGRLAGVFQLYIVFLKHLNCTDEQIDSIIRQHANVDVTFTHVISTREQPEAGCSKVGELEETIVNLRIKLIKQAEALAKQDEKLAKQAEELQKVQTANKILSDENKQLKAAQALASTKAISSIKTSSLHADDEFAHLLDEDDFDIENFPLTVPRAPKSPPLPQPETMTLYRLKRKPLSNSNIFSTLTSLNEIKAMLVMNGFSDEETKTVVKQQHQQ